MWTTTKTKTMMTLLALCWTAAAVFGQEKTGCSMLGTKYTQEKIREVLRRSDEQQIQLAVHDLVLREPGSIYNPRHKIKEWMKNSGWTVEENKVRGQTPHGPQSFTNVVATLDPSRPRRVVLACNYDTKLMSRSVFFNAVHLAMPCALLMSSADQLKWAFRDKTSDPSELTLQFIFFDGNGTFAQGKPFDSLYGVRHLALKWDRVCDPNTEFQTYLKTMDYLILLDRIGTDDTHFKNRFPATTEVYDKLLNIETCLKEMRSLQYTRNTRPLFTPEVDESVTEDNRLPFTRKSVPIIHLITDPFPSVEGNLTTPSYPRMHNLGRVLRVFLVGLFL